MLDVRFEHFCFRPEQRSIPPDRFHTLHRQKVRVGAGEAKVSICERRFLANGACLVCVGVYSIYITVYIYRRIYLLGMLIPFHAGMFSD